MRSCIGSWLAKVATVLGALILIGSAIYADSPRPQFGFDDYLVAPLRVHLLSADDRPALCTTLTENDIERIVTKVNRVWSQAGIRFHVESVVREAAAPASPLVKTSRSLSAMLSVIPSGSYGAEQFNLYYIKEFEVNGVYFPKAIFVQDTASLREVPGGIDEPLPRVTSHELGHALGLPHRQDTTNLMASGTTGTSLNAAEIETARSTATAMSRFVRAPDLLNEADALFEAGKKSEASEIYRRLADLPLDEKSREKIDERLQPGVASALK